MVYFFFVRIIINHNVSVMIYTTGFLKTDFYFWILATKIIIVTQMQSATYIITENESVFKFIDILKSGMADGKNSAPVIALRDYLTSTRTIDNGRKGINDLTYTQAASTCAWNVWAATLSLVMMHSLCPLRCNGIIYKPTLEMFMNEE